MRHRRLMRWVTWALILTVVGLPIWAGRVATTVLAVVLAVGAVLEFARLAKLRPPDGIWLLGGAVVLPTAPAGVGPFDGRVGTVGARAAMTAFGIVWICWSLANLPLLGRDAFVVLFAAACADVGAFVGGKSLRRYAWAARALTPISPNKTWAGLSGPGWCCWSPSRPPGNPPVGADRGGRSGRRTRDDGPSWCVMSEDVA